MIELHQPDAQPRIAEDYGKKYRDALKRDTPTPGKTPNIGIAWGSVIGFIAWGFVFAIAKGVGA